MTAKEDRRELPAREAVTFEQVTKCIEDHADMFEDFRNSGGVSMLGAGNVILLVNASVELGRYFIEAKLGLPPPPALPRRARHFARLASTWGLFVVPKAAFDEPLRARLDAPAPFGCCTVVVLDDFGFALAAWAPNGGEPATA